MKASPVVCSALMICLVLLAPVLVMQAEALETRASVSISSSDFLYDSQPTAASLISNTLNGSAAASAGFYAGAPLVSATVSANGAIQAAAGATDYLLFSGGSGSYTDVTLHVAGNWGVQLGAAQNGSSWVRFSVELTPVGSSYTNNYDSWRSLASGSIQDNSTASPNITVAGGWQQLAGNTSSASGTYAFDLTTRAYYGLDYRLQVSVIAKAEGAGYSAFIDDPLTITTTNGATFTSVSGGTYTASAVPVPPSLLLLAPGLIGLVAMRKRFKK